MEFHILGLIWPWPVMSTQPTISGPSPSADYSTSEENQPAIGLLWTASMTLKSRQRMLSLLGTTASSGLDWPFFPPRVLLPKLFTSMELPNVFHCAADHCFGPRNSFCSQLIAKWACDHRISWYHRTSHQAEPADLTEAKIPLGFQLAGLPGSCLPVCSTCSRPGPVTGARAVGNVRGRATWKTGRYGWVFPSLLRRCCFHSQEFSALKPRGGREDLSVTLSVLSEILLPVSLVLGKYWLSVVSSQGSNAMLRHVTSYYVILRYVVMLCSVTVCYITLCYIMLHYAVTLRYLMLYYATLCYVTLLRYVLLCYIT